MIKCYIESKTKEIYIYKNDILIEVKQFDDIKLKKEANTNDITFNILKLLNKSSIYLKLEYDAKNIDTLFITDDKNLFNLLKPENTLINKLSKSMKKNISDNELKLLLGSTLYELNTIKNVDINLKTDSMGVNNMFSNNFNNGLGTTLKMSKFNNIESKNNTNQNDNKFQSNVLDLSSKNDLEFDLDTEDNTNDLEFDLDTEDNTNDLEFDLDTEDNTNDLEFDLDTEDNTNDLEFDLDAEDNISDLEFDLDAEDNTGDLEFDLDIKDNTSDLEFDLDIKDNTSDLEFDLDIKDNTSDLGFDLDIKDNTNDLEFNLDTEDNANDLEFNLDTEDNTNDLDTENTEINLKENVSINNHDKNIEVLKEDNFNLSYINSENLVSDINADIKKDLEFLSNHIENRLKFISNISQSLKEDDLNLNLGDLDLDEDTIIENFKKTMEKRSTLKAIEKSCRIYANMKMQLDKDLLKF